MFGEETHSSNTAQSDCQPTLTSVTSESNSACAFTTDIHCRSLKRNVKKLVKTCKKGWSKGLVEIFLSIVTQANAEGDASAGLTLTTLLLEGVESLGVGAQSPLVQTYLVLQDLADKVKHVLRNPSVSPLLLKTTFTFWETLYQLHLRIVQAFPGEVEKLLNCLGARLLQSTLSTSVPLLFRQTRCRALNVLLERSSTLQRGSFRNANIIQFFELPRSLESAGDYDFQTSLLEILFRLSSFSERTAGVSQWFPQLPCTHQALFTRIHDFDPDCRRFLNAYNNLLGSGRLVHTFAATSLTIGCLKVQKPSLASYEQLWVDFNLGSSTLSVLCDKTDPGVSTPKRMWETLVVYEDEVVRSELVRTLHADTLSLVLSRPLFEYFSELLVSASQAVAGSVISDSPVLGNILKDSNWVAPGLQGSQLLDPEPVFRLVFQPAVPELATVAAKLFGTKLEMVDNTPAVGTRANDSQLNESLKARRSSISSRKRRKCSVTTSIKTSVPAHRSASVVDGGCFSGSSSNSCSQTSSSRHSKSLCTSRDPIQNTGRRPLDYGGNGEVDNRTSANTTGVNMRTISHTRQKLEESKDPRGVITRAPESLDDRRKWRDVDFVKRVETMINNDPSKSMRSMAAEFGVTVVYLWMKQVGLGVTSEQCSLPCLQPLPRLAGEAYDLVIKHQWSPSSPDLNPMNYFFWGKTATTAHFGQTSTGATKTSITSARVLCRVVAQTSSSTQATGSEDIIPSSIRSAGGSTVKDCSPKSRYKKRSAKSSNGCSNTVQQHLQSGCHDNVKVNSCSFSPRTVVTESRLTTPVPDKHVSVSDETVNESASRTNSNIRATAKVINSTSSIANQFDETSCSLLRDSHSIASLLNSEGCSSKVKDFSSCIDKSIEQTQIPAEENLCSSNTPMLKTESRGSRLKSWSSTFMATCENSNPCITTNDALNTYTLVTTSQGSRIIISAESAQCQTIYPEQTSSDEVTIDLDSRSTLTDTCIKEQAQATQEAPPVNLFSQGKLGDSPLKRLQSEAKCHNQSFPRDISHVLDVNNPDQALLDVGDTEDDIVPCSLTQTCVDTGGKILSKSKLSLNRMFTKIVREDNVSNIISPASVLTEAEIGYNNKFEPNNSDTLVAVEGVTSGTNDRTEEAIGLSLGGGDDRGSISVATKCCTVSEPVVSLASPSFGKSFSPNLNFSSFRGTENLLTQKTHGSNDSHVSDTKCEKFHLSSLKLTNCEAMTHLEVENKGQSCLTSPTREEHCSVLHMGSNQISDSRGQKRSLESGSKRLNSSVSQRISEARDSNAVDDRLSTEPRRKKIKYQIEGFSIKTPTQSRGVSHDPDRSCSSSLQSNGCAVLESYATVTSTEVIPEAPVVSEQMVTDESSSKRESFCVFPPADTSPLPELCTKLTSPILETEERVPLETQNIVQQALTCSEKYPCTGITCSNGDASASGPSNSKIHVFARTFNKNSPQKENSAASSAMPASDLRKLVPTEEHEDHCAQLLVDPLPPSEKQDSRQADHIQMLKNEEKVECVENLFINANYDHGTFDAHQSSTVASTSETAYAVGGQNQFSSVGASMSVSRILISDANQTLMDKDHKIQTTDADIFDEVINGGTEDIPKSAEPAGTRVDFDSPSLSKLQNILCSPQVITDLETGQNYDICQGLNPCEPFRVRPEVTLLLTELVTLFELNLGNENLTEQPLVIDTSTRSSVNRSPDIYLTEVEGSNVQASNRRHKLGTPRKKSRLPSLIFNDTTSSSSGRKWKKPGKKKRDLPEHYGWAEKINARDQRSAKLSVTSEGKLRGCKKKLFDSSSWVLNESPPIENVGAPIRNTDATLSFGDLVPIGSSCDEERTSVLGEDSRNSRLSEERTSVKKRGRLKELAKSCYEEKPSQYRGFNEPLQGTFDIHSFNNSLSNGEKNSKFFTMRSDRSLIAFSKSKQKTAKTRGRPCRQGSKKALSQVKGACSTRFLESDNDAAPNSTLHHTTTIYSDLNSSSSHGWLKGKSKDLSKYSKKYCGKSYLKLRKVSSEEEYYPAALKKGKKKKPKTKFHKYSPVYSNTESASEDSVSLFKPLKKKSDSSKFRTFIEKKSDRSLRKTKPMISYKISSSSDKSPEFSHTAFPHKKSNKSKLPNKSWIDKIEHNRAIEVMRDCSHSSAEKTLQIYEDLDCEKENLVCSAEKVLHKHKSGTCHANSNKIKSLREVENFNPGEKFIPSSDSMELPPLENTMNDQPSSYRNSDVSKLTRFLKQALPETKPNRGYTLKKSLAKETVKKIKLKVPPNTPASASSSLVVAVERLSTIGDQKLHLKRNGPVESTRLDESLGKRPEFVGLSEKLGASPDFPRKETKSASNLNLNSNHCDLERVGDDMIPDRPWSSSDSAPESQNRKIKIRAADRKFVVTSDVDFDDSFHDIPRGNMLKKGNVPATRNSVEELDDNLNPANSGGGVFSYIRDKPLEESYSNLRQISPAAPTEHPLLKPSDSCAVGTDDVKGQRIENHQLLSTTKSTSRAVSPLASASSECRWSLECAQPTLAVAAHKAAASHAADVDVTRLNTNQGKETPQRLKGRKLFSPTVGSALEDLSSQLLPGSDNRSDLLTVPRSRLLLLQQLLSDLSHEVNCRLSVVMDEVSSLLGSDL
ncbi:hypothetical protein FHG87_000931 [Trinorchestia longiramus]|nr:hypothetical protein FHG87_000931 [Trinorchestia longiramus]